MKLSKENVVQMESELEMLGFIKASGTACRFVSMTSKTPVVKIKVGNPWGAGAKTKNGLYKVSKKIGIINAKFCKSVESRIAAKLGVPAAEVQYEAGEVYYEHLMTKDGKPLPIVQHKDETKRKGYLLQYFPQKSENVYVNEAGEPVADEVVKPWLYAESERSEFKPSVIGIYLSNILRLKASGVVIEMPDLAEVESVFAD